MQKIYDGHGCVSAKGLLKMMSDAADKCDACHEAMADEIERLRELLDAERDRAAGIENQYKLTGDQVDVPEARKVGGAGWDETLVAMVRRLVMERGLHMEELTAAREKIGRLADEARVLNSQITDIADGRRDPPYIPIPAERSPLSLTSVRGLREAYEKALAEVERLRGEAFEAQSERQREYDRRVKAEGQNLTIPSEHSFAEREKLTRERDEALARVERLRKDCDRVCRERDAAGIERDEALARSRELHDRLDAITAEHIQSRGWALEEAAEANRLRLELARTTAERDACEVFKTSLARTAEERDAMTSRARSMQRALNEISTAPDWVTMKTVAEFAVEKAGDPIP